LQEKRQNQEQQKQASDAISIYYEILKSKLDNHKFTESKPKSQGNNRQQKGNVKVTPKTILLATDPHRLTPTIFLKTGGYE